MKTEISISVLLLIICMSAQAAVYKIAPDAGKVTFLAKGKPALISIHGEGEGVSAVLREKDQVLSGEISIQLKSLKTGIELRDDHLKNKYLEVDKYPMAVLRISELKLPANFKNGFSFKGILNLHGVDQPVAGDVSVVNDSISLKLTADFRIELSQFKIEIPSFKGITVAEAVQVKVETLVLREE